MIMNMIKSFAIIILFLNMNVSFSVGNSAVRIKNITTKSQFCLLLQSLRERGLAREPISKEDIQEALLRLTGESLGSLHEQFLEQANDDINFELVMEKLPEIALFLQEKRDITSEDILNKFSSMTGRSVKLSNEKSQSLLLNFAKETFGAKRNDQKIIVVLTGLQIFKIAKDLVNNKVQNITIAVIKDRASAAFDIAIEPQDSGTLIKQVQSVYSEICLLYGLLRADMLLAILQKTLKQDLLYDDIQTAYFDMFGVRLKHVDISLEQWFCDVLGYKYKQHLQYGFNVDDVKKVATFFVKNEIVDFEDIQRQFLKQTKEGYLGKLLVLPLSEQKKMVDLVNHELESEAIGKKQPFELEKFLEKYSCAEDVLSEVKNSNKYIIKNGIDRVINAQRAQACIQHHGWKLLSIAQKCLICKKRDCYIVASRVHAQSVPAFSLEEIKELVAFTEATGYQDWGVLVSKGYSANVLRDIETGKLIFIDTEDKSFKVFFADTKFDCVEVLYDSMKHLMPLEVRRWVEKRMADLKENDENIVILPDNSEYDPQEIDFVKVKAELLKLS